jgi:putative oxidoreductase
LGVGPVASMALTVFAEAFCSALVVFGWWTRLAAIPLLVTMGVAFLLVHGADPWQKKEMAFLYFSAYLVIFLAGPGKFSFDGKK